VARGARAAAGAARPPRGAARDPYGSGFEGLVPNLRRRYEHGSWIDQEIRLEDDLSELLQHEHDHLDGTLAVSRALDGESFALRSQRPQSPGPVIRPPA